MSSVFESATKVTAWLGPAYGGSDRAMKLLSRPISYWQVKNRLMKVWNSIDGPCIAGICDRKYWRRLWIFQELQLAREIELMCGSRTITWERFLAFLLYVDACEADLLHNNKREYRTVQASHTLSFVKLSAQNPRGSTLWNLMVATKDLCCSEPRDKIYALLGVATTEPITPHYEMPLPTLLNLVLLNHHRSRPPKSFEEVESQCNLLTNLLGTKESMFDLIGRQSSITPSDADLAAFPFRRSEAHLHPLSLWWAQYYGHSAVEALFFKSGVIDGHDSLISAAYRGCKAAVQILLWTGRYMVEVRDPQYERTPLCWAARCKRISTFEVLLVVTRGINAADNAGNTALHEAAAQGCIEIVQLLCNAPHIDVNMKNVLHETPLHLAARSGHVDVVAALLRVGTIHVDLTDNNLMTALHWAAKEGKAGVVRQLLATGRADLNARNSAGQVPKDLARSRKHYGVLELLVDTERIGWIRP